MSNYTGHVIFEAPGLRAVAIPRDKRISPRCYGCCLFTQRPGRAVACPVDREKRKVCEALGIVWRRIPRPAEQTRALEAEARRRALG